MFNLFRTSDPLVALQPVTYSTYIPLIQCLTDPEDLKTINNRACLLQAAISLNTFIGSHPVYHYCFWQPASTERTRPPAAGHRHRTKFPKSFLVLEPRMSGWWPRRRVERSPLTRSPYAIPAGRPYRRWQPSGHADLPSPESLMNRREAGDRRNGRPPRPAGQLWRASSCRRPLAPRAKAVVKQTLIAARSQQTLMARADRAFLPSPPAPGRLFDASSRVTSLVAKAPHTGGRGPCRTLPRAAVREGRTPTAFCFSFFARHAICFWLGFCRPRTSLLVVFGLAHSIYRE